MYEELVKRLREAPSDWPDADLHYDAADAIEELSAEVLSDRAIFKRYGGETGIKNLQEYASKYWDTLAKIPRWIPVTERLPKKPYGCLAIVWDDNPYEGGDPFLNYYPEYIGFDGERWNNRDGEEIPFEVVYWMKKPEIPEPPKEET